MGIFYFKCFCSPSPLTTSRFLIASVGMTFCGHGVDDDDDDGDGGLFIEKKDALIL